MKKMRKLLSILLCLCMLVQNAPLMAFAATTDNLCEHHTEHTAECGYAEAAAGSDCTHAHEESCGYAEPVAEVLCTCEATDENGTLVHTEGCGYIAPVTGADCTHVHDDACGYVAAAPAYECHYACAECVAAPESEEPSEESSEPAPVCNCGTDDPDIHATTCAVYVRPEDPRCFCAEKCTEPNEWCDVCGFDYGKCGGTDTAVTWAGVDLSTNTASYGNNRGTWYLNPDNAATEFYNLINDKLMLGAYGFVPERTYITTNASDYRDDLGNDGFLWTDCKNQTIQDGRYYIYVFSRNANQINRIEYIVDIQVRYTVNISVTGAPSGYGGVTLNGSNAGSPQYLQKGGSITLSVKDVPSHKHTVSYDNGVTCSQNGDTYAFSNVNKSFTFKVVYEADEFATVSFGQPEGATISVNGNSTSPVQVIAGLPYTVSVKTNDGYYLTGITVDGTTTSLDTTSYNRNLTAGGNGAGHTISVTTAKVAIPVHTTASITYTKNQDKASLVKAIKDAVYAGSNDKNSLTVNYLYFGDFYSPILDSTDIWGSVFSPGEMLSCNVKESVSVKLSSGDVYSQACTLYLYDGDISAKGEIKKDYTEDPVKLDGNDFNCACPANFSSSYPVEYRYYTQSGQRLSSAPTEVGKYQVQVKASSYHTNPGAIVGTSWTSWSGLIPFEIVSVPAYSITIENSSGGRVTASKETSIAGKTVTLTIEPDVGYLVDTVSYNGTAITPVEGVYSFTMPAGAVTISATFKACTHETYENGICTLCGVQHADHTGSEPTCIQKAICDICGLEYGELADHSTGAEGDRAATCQALAYCSVCESEYGELATHSFGSSETCTYGCGTRAQAKANDFFNDNATYYYATLPEALAAAEALNSDGVKDDLGIRVYPLADDTGDFTIPVGISFFGEGYTFSGTVTNNGTIDGGTFNGTVANDGNIEGGTFNGEVTNYGFIRGGTFNGKVTNHDTIWNISSGGMELGENFSIENNGTINCDFHFWKDGACRLCAKICEHTSTGDNVATCTRTAICDLCGASYGEVDTSNHDSSVEFENGFCENGCYEPAELVDGVYQISNAGNLYWFADKVTNENAAYGSADAILTCEIRVNSGTMTEASTDARVWTPIGKIGLVGNQVVRYPYTGTFEGNGKTVSGLYFNDTSANFDVGLFSYVGEGGTVQNVGIADSYLCGSQSIGAVVGNNFGTVTGCYNTGTVISSGTAGGVVGANSGTVTGCYNTGTVSGTDSVGGVVGSSRGSYTYGSGSIMCNAIVTDCYNTGAVSGTTDVGGVVGYNGAYGSSSSGIVFSTAIVTDCHNTGTVSGKNNVGGVVGAHSGIVTGCYNTGTVSGTSDVGGVVAYNNGIVMDCYHSGSISGTTNVSGVVGNNDAAVTNCYFDSTVYTGDAIGTNEGTATNVEGKTTEQFASGEVAYLLSQGENGSIWGQTIGTDPAPIFSDAKVYYGYTSCGDTKADYTNEEATEEKPDHTQKPAYTDNHDGTHSAVYPCCGLTAETGEHTGGRATCTTQAVCEACGASYGKLADHSTSYSADGMTITYKCATCDTQTVTFTLVIPTGAVYGSSGLEVPHYDCSDKTYNGELPMMTLDGKEQKDFVPNAGTYAVTMTWGGQTVSGEYTIAKKELTPIVEGSVTKTYDGTTDVPANHGLSIMLDGIIIGDSISATASYAYDGADAGTTRVNATGITLGGGDTGNYTLKATTASADVGTITKRDVTVTAKDQAIHYGEAISQTEIISSGLLDGHSLTATLTPGTTMLTENGTITASSAVIKANGADVTANYEISYEDGKLVIEFDTSVIDALDPETVNSDSQPDLEAILETIDELLEEEGLTEEQKKTLADAKADAEALLDVIEAARAALDTENTKQVENVTAENVKPEDREALEDAKADLEKALTDNSSNYTDKEKQDIANEIQRIEAAVTALEHVEEVEEVIKDLPETVEPDDEDKVAEIEAAKKIYEALTAHEKSLIHKDLREKLEALLEDAYDYDIIKGDGGKWTKGSSSGLSFTANGPFSKFLGIEVDGKEVDEKYYDAKSGSTIITLKRSFLKKLSTGKHTITVLYTDGETSGTFKILAASSTPATGDEFNAALHGTMLAASISGLIMLILISRKRKHTD